MKGFWGMESTGIVRRIDNLGRVVLPIELRRTFDINKEDPVEIYVDNEYILLKVRAGLHFLQRGWKTLSITKAKTFAETVLPS